MLRVLVIDPDDGARSAIDDALTSCGYDVSEAPALTRPHLDSISRRPDVILLSVSGAEGGDLAALSTSGGLRGVPVIALAEEDSSHGRLALDLGAADYMTKPFDVSEAKARLDSVVRRTRRLMDTSPLTGLPGNAAIKTELVRRYENGSRFAAVHSDLDWFKAYNDHYGFVRGDDVIEFCATCLGEAAAESGHSETFVGHVGGDDFISVMDARSIDRFCKTAIRTWEDGIGALYDEPDRSRGYLVIEDRWGVEQRVPIASLSLGVATNLRRHFSSPWEAAAIAAEMKEYAKRQPGSNYQVDRRA